MIVNYTPTAITKLNISKFTYSTNEAIWVNALKYQNDSSVTYRLMQAASAIIDTQKESLPYHIRFDYNKIENSEIDAVNLYNINLSSFKENDIIYLSSLYGYSKYTSAIYKLHGIYSAKEFTRFSYPCDIIFTAAASGLYDLSPIEVILQEGIKTKINKAINNSRITVRPTSGFNKSSLAYVDDVIHIHIEGFDISHKKVYETLDIDEYTDFVSYNEYSIVTNMYTTGNKTSVRIDLFPYILGESVTWKDEIVDRESSDKFKAIATINKNDKQLLFCKRLNNVIDYPDIYDIETRVDLALDSDEEIYSYLITSDLIYTITSKNKLHVFPLVIPYEIKTSYDSLKTKEQSIKVSYYNDEINNTYNFTVIPSTKNSDIEILNIYINGEIYKNDIILDLFIEGLEDNRFNIPYENIYNSNDEAIVIFETYGSKQCTLPIYLKRRKLDALFTRDLSTLSKYSNNAINYYTTDISDSTYFIENYTFSTYPKYKDPEVSGYKITEDSKLYKLSSSKNIILDNYILSNVYNTFYFEKETGELVVHDSITSLRLDNSSTSNIYENLSASIAGMAVSGKAITGLEK